MKKRQKFCSQLRYCFYQACSFYCGCFDPFLNRSRWRPIHDWFQMEMGSVLDSLGETPSKFSWF